MHPAAGRLLAALLLAASARSAFGVPACPAPASLAQPDGSRVLIHLRGDEFRHWNEDDQGYTVMKHPRTGAWSYAAKRADGVLEASEHQVGRANPRTLGLPLRLQPDGVDAQVRTLSADSLAAAASTGKVGVAATTGLLKNLVVLVDFSDLAHTRTAAEYDALFNTVGYTLDGAKGSVRDYYTEVSYGALTLQSVVADWVTLTNGYAYYGGNNVSGSDLHPQQMVREALALLEARGFDFTTVDADHDGWVDGLTIIHAGGGEEYSGNNANYIWSHKWSLTSTVVYDGISMFNYHTEPERRGWDSTPSTWGITRIGVICHETGHFLGLPDLYDTGYDSKGIGDFCLMAGGSWNGDNGTQPAHMSVWCKKSVNWITPTVISSPGTYTLPRIEDSQSAYRLQGSFPSTQYFLVENRQGFGFDASMPGASRGLLIWHIDEAQANNNDQTHYKVDVEEASGTQHLELNQNEGDDADYYRSGNNTTFTDTTTPNNKSYAGVALGLNLLNVSATGASMTFDIQGANSLLTVVSTYGRAYPPAGTNTFTYGTNLTCYVTNSPISISSATNWQSCLCTGWTGNGSVPASGNTTNTGSFTLGVNSTLVWNWVVTDLVVSNQTVAASMTNQARDTVLARDGFRVQSPGTAELRAGRWVKLQSGFGASTGARVRVRSP